VGLCGSRRSIVNQIKSYQRENGRNRRAWKNYILESGFSSLDPARHSLATLCDFLAIIEQPISCPPVCGPDAPQPTFPLWAPDPTQLEGLPAGEVDKSISVHFSVLQSCFASAEFINNFVTFLSKVTLHLPVLDAIWEFRHPWPIDFEVPVNKGIHLSTPVGKRAVPVPTVRSAPTLTSTFAQRDRSSFWAEILLNIQRDLEQNLLPNLSAKFAKHVDHTIQDIAGHPVTSRSLALAPIAEEAEEEHTELGIGELPQEQGKVMDCKLTSGIDNNFESGAAESSGLVHLARLGA